MAKGAVFDVLKVWHLTTLSSSTVNPNIARLESKAMGENS